MRTYVHFSMECVWESSLALVSLEFYMRSDWHSALLILFTQVPVPMCFVSHWKNNTVCWTFSCTTLYLRPIHARVATQDEIWERQRGIGMKAKGREREGEGLSKGERRQTCTRKLQGWVEGECLNFYTLNFEGSRRHVVYFSSSSSDLLVLLKCVCGSACVERGQDWRRRPLIRLMRPCDILRSTSAAAEAKAAQSLFLPPIRSTREEGEFPVIYSLLFSRLLLIQEDVPTEWRRLLLGA